MSQFRYWLVAVVVLVVVVAGGGAQAQLTKHAVTLVKGSGTAAMRFKSPALTASKGLTVPFGDNFEGTFPGNWYFYDNPHFGLTTYRHASGTHSLYCAAGGTGAVAAPGPYPANFTGWITYGPFSLSGVTAGQVAFKLWNNSGSGDSVFAGWSLDDYSYKGMQWTGNSSGWVDATADMTGYKDDQGNPVTYVGQPTVYFSFYFSSDSGANTSEGAYVDDVAITTGTTPPVTTGITGFARTSAGVAIKGAVASAGSTFAYTGADGKYTLNVPAGTYKVVVQKPGYAFSPASASITVTTAVAKKNFVGTVRSGDGVVNYWAVSVGINNYLYVNGLQYTVNDAKDVTAALIAGGYPATHIRQLCNAQATKAGIRSAVAWMASKADADDVCVYFQSSHGDRGPDIAPIDETDGYDEYLCTYDTSLSNRNTEIRDDEFGQWMAALKTRKYLVLIDTCYSGGLIKGLTTGPGWGSGFAHALNGMSTPGQVATKDLGDLGSGVVVTASKASEESEESGQLKNGVFAYYLVQGMNNGKADFNKNGWYAAEEIYNYSKNRAHNYNPQQTLVLYDAYPGQLNFAKAKAAAAVAASPALAVTGTAAATKSGFSSIMLSLSAPANVTASILNLAGREVAVLGGQDLSQGVSTLLWNGKSKLGTSVPSGQYLVRVQAKDTAGNSAACLLTLRK